jgi:hypothetical protein
MREKERLVLSGLPTTGETLATIEPAIKLDYDAVFLAV